VDNFLGGELGQHIMGDVLACVEGLREGQLMSDVLESRSVRGDDTMWLDSGRSRVIDDLVKKLDGIVMGVASSLGEYQIGSRTKAMVSRYPAEGRGYEKHVDNHMQDGRVITCIYYLNENYNRETDGGLLRMYPSQLTDSIDIEPKFDRIIFFWSDQRTPHEVLPAYRERYAITVWYFDDIQRRNARQQLSKEGQDSKRMSPVACDTTER